MHHFNTPRLCRIDEVDAKFLEFKLTPEQKARLPGRLHDFSVGQLLTFSTNSFGPRIVPKVSMAPEGVEQSC